MKQQNLFSLFLPKITRTNGVNPRLFFWPTHQWKRLAPQPSSAAPPTLPPGTCQKMACRNPQRGGQKERHDIFLLTLLWILKLFYIVLETRATFLIQRTSSVVPVHLHGMSRSKSFELGHKGVARGIPFLIDSTVDLSTTSATILLHPSVCPRET